MVNTLGPAGTKLYCKGTLHEHPMEHVVHPKGHEDRMVNPDNKSHRNMVGPQGFSEHHTSLMPGWRK